MVGTTMVFFFSELTQEPTGEVQYEVINPEQVSGNDKCTVCQIFAFFPGIIMKEKMF